MNPLEPGSEPSMLLAMSPGVFTAIGIVAGAVLGIAIGNAFVGIGVGVAAGVGWYFGMRALASRRRP